MRYIKNRSLVAVGLAGLAVLGSRVLAAPLTSADITQAVNQVEVALPGQAPRPAKVQERVGGSAQVQTGQQSRAELMFADKTLTRLGANTVFSFTKGTRDMQLTEGTMLLRVPKGAGGAKISTAAVSAAITGTTVMVESHVPPQGAQGKPFTKWIVLEGTMRVYINNRIGESRLVQPGQMIILPPNARTVPLPVDVDLERLVRTSNLVEGGPEDLESTPLIVEEIEQQNQEIENGKLLNTNVVILGSGTELILANEELLEQLDQAQDARNVEEILKGEKVRKAEPVGTTPPLLAQVQDPGEDLSKYLDVLPVLQGDPFVISASTTIITDPVIQNAGQPPQTGSIYNASVQGLAAPYLFDGTPSSPLDTFINASMAAAGDVAVFKFPSIEIAGTPNVITTDGPDNLALISQRGITTPGYESSFNALAASEGPAGLDLTGLNNVYLIAENGDVALNYGFGPVTGPAGTLALVARGTGNNVFVDTSILMPNSGTLAIGADGGVVLGYGAYLSAPTISIRSGSGDFDFSTNAFDLERLQSLSVSVDQVSITGDLDFGWGSNTASLVVRGGEINAGTRLLGFKRLDVADFISVIEIDATTLYAGGGVSTTGDIHSRSITAGSYVSGANITADAIKAGGAITASGDLTQRAGELPASRRVGVISSPGDITAGGIFTPNVSLLAFVPEGGESVPGLISATRGSIEAYSIDGGAIQSAGDILTYGSALARYWGIQAGGDIRSANGGISATMGDIEAVGVLRAGGGAILAEQGVITSGGDADPVGILAKGDIRAQQIHSVGAVVSLEGSIVAQGLGENLGLINITNGLGIFAKNSLVADEVYGSLGGVIIGVGSTAAEIPLPPSAFTIQAENADIGYLSVNAPAMHFDTVNLRLGDFGSEYGLPVASFSGRIRNLTLGGYSPLVVTGDMGSLKQRVNINFLDFYSGLTQSGDDDGLRIYANAITGPGSITADLVDATSLEFQYLSTEALVVGSGGIRRNGLANSSITYTGAAPMISLGGAQFNNLPGQPAAGALNIDATESLAPIIFGDGGIRGANFNGGADPAGNAGALNVTAREIILDGTSSAKINANTAHAAAAGGTVTLTSTKVGGTGITINNSSEIRAIMAAGATGPGGRIWVGAQDAGIRIAGKLDAGTTSNAQRTEIRITQGMPGQGSADVGPIELASTASLNADVIKVGTFGPNGSIIIGGGRLTANDTLKLYAPNSGGLIRFTGNAVLDGAATQKILAANTVQIDNGRVVTVNGPAAQVYTNNPRYTGSGGNGATTGMFGGSGAVTTIGVVNAPNF